MTFLNSIKLFGSNWDKVWKLFLYYLFVWGVTICLLLPVFFEFSNVIRENIQETTEVSSYLTIFHNSFGGYLNSIFVLIYTIFLECVAINVGLLVYGLIVVFLFMPFLLNIGKYAICEMLYGYMASKTKVGFFSAFFKTLNKSVLYSLCKTLYSLLFYALTTYLVFLVGLVENTYFQTYFLALCEIVLLAVLFTLNKVTTACWAPASIVFGCSVASAYIRGVKVVFRRFWRTLPVALVIFLLFFFVTFIAGVYSLVITVPFVAVLLCMFDMVTFFTSQGMRYYINKSTILTPKKLEEVDNINRAKYIL